MAPGGEGIEDQGFFIFCEIVADIKANRKDPFKKCQVCEGRGIVS